MTLVHLANLMQNWGIEVHPDHYYSFEAYLNEMLRRDRVMVIWNGVYIEAVILFYLTNDYEALYRKPMWKVAEDNSDGHQIYIDKMVCRRWTKTLRKLVYEAIEAKFPNVTVGYYHRAPKDRCVKIIIRSRYELQSAVS